MTVSLSLHMLIGVFITSASREEKTNKYVAQDGTFKVFSY